MKSACMSRVLTQSYKNSINKSAMYIHYYRKGYMAPDCNLYTSMIRMALPSAADTTARGNQFHE
jgi:hypothetical protein